MELSTNELLTFIKCPYAYRFRWEQNTPVLKIKAHEHWKNCIYTTSLNFFKTWVDSGRMPSIQELQESWQYSWFPPSDLDVALDFSGSQRKTKQTLGNEGWLNLLHMHRFFGSNPMEFAGIDYPYSINTGKNVLTGKIDILAYTSSDKTRMMGIKLCPTTYEATKMYGYNGLEMVAYKMAIQDLQKVTKDYLGAKKEQMKAELGFFVLENVNKPFYNTRRTDEQEEILVNTVDSICSAIQSSIYYPDYGYKCHNCDFKQKCNKGRWIESEN